MRNARVTWKQKRIEPYRPESNCDRYYITETHGPAYGEARTVSSSKKMRYRLFHRDSSSEVGLYETEAEAKAAAQKHLEGFAKEVWQLRERIVEAARLMQSAFRSDHGHTWNAPTDQED